MPNVIRDDSLPLKRLQAMYSRIVPKPEFDKTLEDFVRTITVKPEYVDDIIAAIAELWRGTSSKATRSQPTAPRVPPEPAKPDSGDRGQNARCHERNGAYVPRGRHC